MIVRPVRVKDAEEIAEILNPIIVGGRHTVLDTPVSVEYERDFIAAFPEGGLFLVAVESGGGRVVGFQTLEPMDALYTSAFDHVGILGTYVAEGHRRQGVARALFRQMFPLAVAAGFEKISTFVRADNPAALAAYRAQGFSVVGTAEKHAKLNGLYVDEVFIEKQL